VPALSGRVCDLVVSLLYLLTFWCSRLTPENIAKDGEHCHECIELARKARRKSLSRVKDSKLPPDSAKIRKILELLNEINSRKNEEGEPPGEKTIVFSQFTTMLDLIELFLKDAGIIFVRCEISARIPFKHIADNLYSLIRRREHV
jgi:SNF2 family DNA or RNA helicase